MEYKIDTKPFNAEYSPKTVMSIIHSRDYAVLDNKRFVAMKECGRLIDISGKNTKTKTYMYFDQENSCPISPVHFYAEDGKLLFTYPWNGEIEQKSNTTFSLVPCGGLNNVSEIWEIKACSTASGRIAIKTHYCSAYKFMNQENIETSVFTQDGKKEYYRLGAISTCDYPFKHMVTKPGKFKYTDFDMIRKDGDTFIDYVKTHARNY